VTGAAAGGAARLAGPPLKYPGAKWRLADWIVAHLPPHEVYVEPYFGSGAIFFAKPPAGLSTLNDLDGNVVTLWRVLRDRPDDLARALALTPWAREEFADCYRTIKALRLAPATDDVERARRFLVSCWQQFGGRTSAHNGGWRFIRDTAHDPFPVWDALPERLRAAAAALRGAQIENRPALDVIARSAGPDTLLYCDPPYPHGTRERKRLRKEILRQYAREMTDADHAALLDALDAHPGPVALSGYACALYDERLAHWGRATRMAHAEGSVVREEVLWLSPRTVELLEKERQVALPGWSGTAAGG
jgi:DNA adenine methylase